MKDFIFSIIPFIAIAVKSGTPLLLATSGEILTEKAGNLNLGVEGMMLMGAFAGFQMAVITSNPVFALVGAMVFAAFGALIYAFLTVSLRANQTVTGLCITIFGSGIAGFLGSSLNKDGAVVPKQVTQYFQPINIPILSKLPILGDLLFKYDIFIYLAIFLAFAVYWYINKTKIGLNLRAVGENPAAADSAGINVALYKYINIMIGGALCGLGGAYLSVVYIPNWTNNIVSGRGWIAVALVIFASWNPIKAIYGSILFGGLSVLSLVLQGSTLNISAYFLDLLPYLFTIIALIIISIRMSREKQQPNGCGENYFREDR